MRCVGQLAEVIGPTTRTPNVVADTDYRELCIDLKQRFSGTLGAGILSEALTMKSRARSARAKHFASRFFPYSDGTVNP